MFREIDRVLVCLSLIVDAYHVDISQERFGLQQERSGELPNPLKCLTSLERLAN